MLVVGAMEVLWSCRLVVVVTKSSTGSLRLGLASGFDLRSRLPAFAGAAHSLLEPSKPELPQLNDARSLSAWRRGSSTTTHFCSHASHQRSQPVST